MTSIHSSSLTRYPVVPTRPQQTLTSQRPVELQTAVTEGNQKPESTVYTRNQLDYSLAKPLIDTDWQQRATTPSNLKAIQNYRNTHNQYAQVDSAADLAGIDLYA